MTLVFEESGWCEALKRSYMQGPYEPKSRKEYEALKPFAQKPVPDYDGEDGEEKEKSFSELKDELKALGGTFKVGMGIDAVKAEIAKLKGAA